jgi:hypothetical protein
MPRRLRDLPDKQRQRLRLVDQVVQVVQPVAREPGQVGQDHKVVAVPRRARRDTT